MTESRSTLMRNNPTTSPEEMVNERRASKSVLLFGLVSIALVAIVGTTVDLSRLATARGDLQQRLDRALAAGVHQGSGNRVGIAEDAFDSMATGSIAGATDRRFEDDAGGLSGTVTAIVPTTLSRVIGIRVIRVTASGRAAPAARCADPVIRAKDLAGCAISVSSSTRTLPQP